MPKSPLQVSAPSTLSFSELYHLYFPKVLAQVRKTWGNEGAEDITQEVFLKIHSRLHEFKGNAQLATWIYRIARNACIDALRRNPPQGELRGREINPPEAPTPEQVLVTQEMSGCVRKQIDQLQVELKTVLELSEFVGLKNQEIADHLGISLETVKIRLHRARAQLKQILTLRCDFYHNEHNHLVCDQKTTPT
ncbi:MAG: hypothetical protein A2484_01940 [Nitrospirae bacterium RIFOXYC2_FULL_44_7]|nr:MAG: hypothetical protein A2484_01940 [Nitrospirae bacterium RIFOXYC2_FULL_44_7]